MREIEQIAKEILEWGCERCTKATESVVEWFTHGVEQLEQTKESESGTYQ